MKTMQEKQTKCCDGVVRLLKEATSIAMVSHIAPDGDTVGSTLALMHMLRQMDKQVSVWCDDDVPHSLQFLPGKEAYRKPESLQAEEHFSLLVCVDVPEQPRMGRCQALIAHAEQMTQIDHHATNPLFCQENFVRDDASATAVLMNIVREALDCPVTKEIATCLLVGISTDTLHFSTPNTTPEAFSTAQMLMEKGQISLTDIHRRLYRQHTPGGVALLQRALGRMAYSADGRITTTYLTQEDFQQTEGREEEVLAFGNYAVGIEGVRLAAFLREKPDGAIAVSFRSYAPDDISRVAVALGGGGHAQAAGCTLHLPMEEAVQTVTKQMQHALEEME